MFKLVIASDHAGFSLKKQIVNDLSARGDAIVDLGPDSEVSVDYPDFAALVARALEEQRAERGLLICGTGVGMALTANRFKNVRAAALTDIYSVKMAREHNDLNLLCLGARVVGPGLAFALIQTFLTTEFAGGRHAARVQKIHSYDSQ